MDTIKFYYDIEDNTLETIVDGGIVINQGQNQSLELLFYFGNYSSGSFVNALNSISMIENPCLLNIERPDGTSSNNIATSPITDNPNDLHFKLIVSDWITAIAGILEITAKRYNPVNDTTETFGLATLNILASAEQSVDTIEDAQYQALVSYLATTGLNRYEVIADGGINELDLVMFSGTVGGSGKIKVKKANINIISEHPEYVLGIALNDANNNETLYVQTEGIIREIDTSGFEEEKVLIPSNTDGGLIEYDNENSPQKPLNRMPIAVCIYSHQNHGIIMVRPTFYPDMAHIQDVDVSGINQGDVLKYDSYSKLFKPGKAQGVYYSDDLPDEEDRYNNLTYFDNTTN